MRITADSVRVRVPATSANLGPGFDCFGLALGRYDVVSVRATTGATTTAVIGQGAGSVPEGEDHLVVRALRAGLDHVGAPQVGLDLRAENSIPHGRGLGSSAAAVVAGLALARGLISEPEALDDQTVLAIATAWEGHPDNAAACILGGATLAWLEDDQTPRAEMLPVDPQLSPTVLIPATSLATARARRVLPEQVPYRDAAFTLARASLLVLALAGRTDLLFTATQDRLHQPYRRDVLPASTALVERLRSHRLPAVISGAGPTVLTLGPIPAELAKSLPDEGWTVLPLPVDAAGAAAVV